MKGLVDEIVHIKVACGSPFERVRLQGRFVDKTSLAWESWADFLLDADGALDVASATPLAGTYHEPDPNGLLWSMVPADVAAAYDHSVLDGTSAVRILVGVEGDSGTSDAKQIELGWFKSGVRREVVDHNGLKGFLWVPAGEPPFRPVLSFGGSDGGVHEESAALLASHGFLTLALAYFRYPGLSDDLVSIPLEYFESALDLLAGDRRVPADRGVGVVGRSRGGELALLLGATFPEVDAIVAYVPSGIVHSGIPADPTSWQSDVPSWTHDGVPVPYLSHFAKGQRASELAPPARLTPLYCRDLAEWEMVQAAAIPVENARARMLLLSGTHDAMWPSSLFSELVVARLHAAGYEHPYRHIALWQAGHRFSLPTLPATVTAGRHPADGQVYEYGGTPGANARAGWVSHRAMLDWLAGRASRGETPSPSAAGDP